MLFVQHCREKPHVLLCLSNVVWPTYLRDFGYQGRKKWHSMSPGLHPSEADRQETSVPNAGAQGGEYREVLRFSFNPVLLTRHHLELP